MIAPTTSATTAISHSREVIENYVREIGKDSYGNVFCHGIRVDAQDNIWVIDEGANMIIKYNPEGRAVMTIGRRIGFPYNGMEPVVKELSPAPPQVVGRGRDPAGGLAQLGGRPA